MNISSGTFFQRFNGGCSIIGFATLNHPVLEEELYLLNGSQIEHIDGFKLSDIACGFESIYIIFSSEGLLSKTIIVPKKQIGCLFLLSCILNYFILLPIPVFIYFEFFTLYWLISQ